MERNWDPSFPDAPIPIGAQMSLLLAMEITEVLAKLSRTNHA
jgi:hypothetical protein